MLNTDRDLTTHLIYFAVRKTIKSRRILYYHSTVARATEKKVNRIALLREYKNQLIFYLGLTTIDLRVLSHICDDIETQQASQPRNHFHLLTLSYEPETSSFARHRRLGRFIGKKRWKPAWHTREIPCSCACHHSNFPRKITESTKSAWEQCERSSPSHHELYGDADGYDSYCWR